MLPEMTPGPEMPAQRAVAGGAALGLARNLPNLITLARLLSVPAALWLIVGQRYGAAFWLFVAAGLSDALDGFIAKRFDFRTRLGALLDPAADKALLAGVYLTLGLGGQLPPWLVGLVILRDVLIVAGFAALHSTAAGRQWRPLYISKVNTLVQLTLVGFVLARLGLGIEAGPVTWLLIVAAGTTTVWSGLAYLMRCARLLSGSEPAL